MDRTSELLKMVAKYSVCIGYSTLPGEPELQPILASLGLQTTYTIAPTASTDPTAKALHYVAKIGGEPTLIFIPGQAFDASGTRLGRGGGWYDRFLSEAPPEWLRIGVCFAAQFSNTPIKRESWDQPVDFVCVVEDQKRTFVGTNARTVY